MESEISPESGREMENKALAEKWTSMGRLEREETVVVDRSGGGLDLFELAHYNLETGLAMLAKAVPGQVLTKKVRQGELLAVNNPVKPASKWLELYHSTAGTNKVASEDAVRELMTDDLMTITEFEEYVKGIPGPSRELWDMVAEKFRENMDQLSGGAGEQKRTKRRIEALGQEGLEWGEWPRSDDGSRGRRIIVSGTNALSYIFQGRTYGPENVRSVGNESGEGEKLRVYLQVETADIPQMVKILKEIGGRWAKDGKTLDFKWLLATAENLEKRGIAVGEFAQLKDEDPRIVVDFKDDKERNDLIYELMGMGYREDMMAMARRRGEKGGVPGASVIYDRTTSKKMSHIYIDGEPVPSEEAI